MFANAQALPPLNGRLQDGLDRTSVEISTPTFGGSFFPTTFCDMWIRRNLLKGDVETPTICWTYVDGDGWCESGGRHEVEEMGNVLLSVTCHVDAAHQC